MGAGCLATEDVGYRGWTKARNFLLDVIIPEVNKKSSTDGMILLKMERETMGFHREFAKISITEFCDYAGKGKTAVREAIKRLVKSKYLEIIKKGTGNETSEYRLVLDRRKPKKRKIEINEIIQLCDNNENAHTEDQSRTLQAAPVTFNDPQRIPADAKKRQITEMNAKPERHSPRKDARPKSDNHHNPNAPAHHIHQHDLQAGRAEKPSKIAGVENLPPPYIEDNKEVLTKTISEGKNITNKDTEPEVSKPEPREERRKAVRDVCYFLKSRAFRVERQDRAFLTWCINHYGSHAVLSKLSMMKYEMQRGAKIRNPFGWLRSSLSRRFEFCGFDAEVEKAKKRAQAVMERAEMESEKWRQTREEWETYRDINPNAGNDAYRNFLALIGDDS